jgi:hypothetical protein
MAFCWGISAVSARPFHMIALLFSWRISGKVEPLCTLITLFN